MASDLWIPLRQSIWRHRKTIDLAARLQLRPSSLAVLHLTQLWHWALDNVNRQGDLGDPAPLIVSEAAQWMGDPDLFLRALVGAEWVDVEVDEDGRGHLLLHEWYEHVGHLLEARERERDRKHVDRCRSIHCTDAAHHRLSAGRPPDTRYPVPGPGAAPFEDDGRTGDRHRAVRGTSGGPSPDRPEDTPRRFAAELGGPDVEAVKLWQRALKALQGAMNRANFETYFAGTVGVRFDDGDGEAGALVVSVPNALTRATLEERFRQAINRALYDVLNRPQKVRLVAGAGVGGVAEPGEGEGEPPRQLGAG